MQRLLTPLRARFRIIKATYVVINKAIDVIDCRIGNVDIDNLGRIQKTGRKNCN